jgi:ribonuclease HI
MKVVIYSDGGADPNPGVGGWAAILRAAGREKVLTGNAPWTTNNRMELQAAIAALQALKRPASVEFHTDSEYLRRGITEFIEAWAAGDWKRKDKPVPNAELWQLLWDLTKQHDIRWHWVKAHAGDPLNERVDALARRARLEITPSEQVSESAPRIFVRGSCEGNPGPGGWGVVLEYGENTEQMSGSEAKSTNNRMELKAAIEGLRMILPGDEAQILTTSDYVFQGATRWIQGWRGRGWKKRDGRPVSNQDLWKELDRLAASVKVRWVSAKGQADNFGPGMEEAAKLARQAIGLEK